MEQIVQLPLAMAIVILLTIVIGFIVLIIAKWHQINSWIFPERYISADILLKDNSIAPILKRKQLKKPEDGLGFYYGVCFYLYDEKLCRINNRLQHWYYIEGCAKPIDPFLIEKSENTKGLEEYKKVILSDLWKKDDELQKMLIYIALGAVLGLAVGAIIGYMVKKGEYEKALEAGKASALFIPHLSKRVTRGLLARSSSQPLEDDNDNL